MQSSKETLEEFRVVRLQVNKDMLKNIQRTAKQTNCANMDMLRLRSELTRKIMDIESKLDTNAPASAEEQSLIEETRDDMEELL